VIHAGRRAGALGLERRHPLGAGRGGIEAVHAIPGADIQDATPGQRDAVEEILEVEAEVADVALRPLSLDDREVALDGVHGWQYA
jgi:hypothetical protein